MIPSRWVMPLACAVLGLVIGLGAGWKLWRPNPSPAETNAPEVKLEGGGVMLARDPQGDAKPKQEVPRGAKVERVVQVTVKPRPLDPIPFPTEDLATRTSGAPVDPPKAVPCPPVRVDLSLVRMQDQTRRVLASSPDGEIVGGIDVPAEPAAPTPRPIKWTASVIRTWEPMTGRQSWGAQVQRNAGPFVFGVGGFQGTAFASIGVRF